MNCLDYQKLIPLYLDGELSAEDQQKIDYHLTHCSACQKEAKAIQEIWEMLGEAPAIEPAPNYMARFQDQLSRQTPLRRKIMDFIQRTWTPKHLVPALVGACALFVVGIFSWQQYQVQQQTQQLLAGLNNGGLDMVQHLDLVENFEIIQQMDFLEDFDLIEQLDTLKT